MRILSHRTLRLPKPGAHTTRSTPDHMGNGEARPLMQAVPVEPLQARPTEAALMGHRTPPPNDMLSSKICCRGTGLQGGAP